MPDDARWRDHLQDAILPWWADRGADDADGGVFTCFDNHGALLSREKYTWSQGRWAWLCGELATESVAGRLGVDADRWAVRARRTARFLVEHVVLPDHRTAYRTDAHGTPLPNPPDGALAISVFADLFVVLGLAGALRCGSSERERQDWLETAVAILLAAEQAISNRTALTAPYPVPEGFADLAGPMNLLHAASEVLRAHDDERARGVRDRARSVLIDRFLHHSWWWEFRPERGNSHDLLLARHRTPGHLLELVWMLLHSDDEARQRGEEVHTDLGRLGRLAARAVELGQDARHGGLLRYIDHRGGPPTGDRKSVV